MNYHLEHHMFPMVPYHNLARLHALIKADCPKPYNGFWEAWREIIPVVLRQIKDPAYYLKRELPTPSIRSDAAAASHVFTAKGRPVDGWVEICASSFLRKEDVIRFDHEKKTYAIYRVADGSLHATDGICTHGNAHLADGFVSGTLIECAKHNGRFNILDGSPRRSLPASASRHTRLANMRERSSSTSIRPGVAALPSPQPPTGSAWSATSTSPRSSRSLFLSLSPARRRSITGRATTCNSTSPPTTRYHSHEIAVTAPFDEIWRAEDIFRFHAASALPIRRNYSFASAPAWTSNCDSTSASARPRPAWIAAPGPAPPISTVSSRATRLLPSVRWATFHIKPGEQRNGVPRRRLRHGPPPLAPRPSLRKRKDPPPVSFWYGARSLRESYYRDYFENLAKRFPNFRFHLALSEPRPEDNWQSYTGFVHEVLRENYLAKPP